MVDLPIHDKVSGFKVTWNLNLLNTIHVKMPTEHANWLYTYYHSYEELQHLWTTHEILSFGTDISTESTDGRVSSDNTP